MLLPYLILTSALSISGVAIYFSIAGLTTIFPGAFWPIVIMGTSLEVGKLVCASWLHHNWREAPRMLKFYLTTAVIVLIFITSMGIFGFLSKSHIEQQRDVNQANSSIAQLTNKINNEKNYITRQEDFIKRSERAGESTIERTDFNIELEQKKIKDLEESLAKSISYDQEELTRISDRLAALDGEMITLQESSGGLFSNKKAKIQALEGAQTEERSQLSLQKSKAEESIAKNRSETSSQISIIRQRLVDFQDKGTATPTVDPKMGEYEQNIRDAYERIDGWETERFTVEASIAEMEVEVGPIKYIAALVEDMGIASVALAEAVRIVILILVFVFDPLAVVMLLAANMNFRNSKKGSYEKLSDEITDYKKKGIFWWKR
jgi:predicted  nucleic acid-binding Zn-ribbon protein